MNKRIRILQLWKDASVQDDSTHPRTYDQNDHIEKFAELIVQKCISEVAMMGIQNYEDPTIVDTVETIITNIRMQFGIDK